MALTPGRPLTNIEIEKLEVLDGSRAKGEVQDKAAVRIRDLRGLLQLPTRLQSTQLGGVATLAQVQAQSNAIQKDVANIFAQLQVLGAALRGRLD